MALTDADLAVS